MDLDKIYYNEDGEECNILQLVKSSPEWAANRIQKGEKVIKKIEKMIEHTKNKKGMKVCLTGLLTKIAKYKGQTLLSGGYHDLYIVAEFFGLYTSHICNHSKLSLKDWKTDDYNIKCPDCNKWVSYEEIQERNNHGS